MKEPKIRFKGFRGEWEESTLGKISTSYNYGINAAAIQYDGTNKYLRITDIDENTRMFSQEDLTSPGTDLSCCNDYLLEDGDITIARTGASVGKSYIYHLSDGKVYFAGFLIRTRLNDNVDKDCVFYSTLTDKYAKYIRLVSQRSGQPGVNVEELKGYTFNLPCDKAEQQSIASYFQHLDALIQSTTKKIESLKQVKAASLQSMFPQEGETTPRVRFKGFEGEWEKVRASNVFKTFNEKNRPDLPVLSATQDRGMVTRESIGYNIFHDKSNEATYKHILPGQFIIHLRSFQGGFAHSSIEGIASPAYTIMEFKDKTRHFDLYWKYIFMSKEFIKRLELITYGIRDGRSISFEEFSEMYFTVPSYEEQKKIASYITILDRQISLQTQRLEKLKQIKAACLDNMFV